MLSELLCAAGVGNTDIRSARIAVWGQSGFFEVGAKNGAGEDFPDAGYVVGRGRGGAQQSDGIFRGAAAVEPNQRDVVFRRPDSRGVRGRF